MKTIVKTCLFAAITLAGFEYTRAQSAASSSKEVVQVVPQNEGDVVAPDLMVNSRDSAGQRSDHGLPMPTEIENLLRARKVTEAVQAYEKFQAQQKGKASDYNLLYNACGFYGWAKEINPSYTAKYNELQKEMLNKFPDEPEVYLMQITDETPDEKVIEMMTKAIEKNPNLSILYEYRGRAYLNLNQTKEACQDFEKLSHKDMMPEYWNCNK